jgi:autotransporter translocation and assembly factor TamB
LREIIVTFNGVNFDADSLSLNFSKHIISAENLRLNLPGKTTFVSIKNARVLVASSSGVLDAFYSPTLAEKIYLDGIRVYANAEFPKDKKNRNPAAEVPSVETYILGLSIITDWGNFNFDDLKAQIIRTEEAANLKVELPKGPFGGIGKIAAITNLTDGKTKAHLNWKHDDFQKFIPFGLISHLYGVSIQKGRVNLELEWDGILQQRLKNPTENLIGLLNEELSGNFSVEDCELKFADMEASLNINGLRTATEPWKCHFVAQNKGSKVEVSADWLGGKDNPTLFKAVISANSLNLTPKAYKSLGMPLKYTKPGLVDFQGVVSGNKEGINGEGKALARKWEVNKKRINKAEIDWRINNTKIDLTGKLLTELGNLQADLSFFPLGELKGQGQVKGVVSKLNLGALDCFLDTDINGDCTGEFESDFDLNNPSSSTYKMDLNIQNLNYLKFKAAKLSGKVIGIGERWELKEPKAFFANGGSINLKGVVSSENLDAEIDLRKVALENFGIPEDIASGAASIKGKVSGSFLEPKIVGDLWASRISIMDQKMSSLKGQINFDKESFILSPIVMIPMDEGMIDGYFSIDLPSGEINSFKVNFQKLSVGIIKPFLPANLGDVDLEGRVAGSVSFNGQKEKDYWDFFVNGRKLKLGDQELDTIFLEGSIWGRQGEIRHLFVRSFGGTIEVSGQVLSKDKFTGSIEAESLYLEKAPFMQRIFPGLRGEINLQGDIVWEKDSKKGFFTVFGNKIKINDRELGNLGGEVNVNNQEVKIVRGDFDKLGVSCSGNLQLSDNMPYTASLDLKKVDLSFIPIAHEIKGFDYGGLIVDGKCKMSGDLASLTPDIVEMELDSLKIRKDNDVIVSNKPLHLIYQNESIEIRSLELKFRQGILGVEGLYRPGVDAALMIEGQDFSIKALGNLLNAPDWNYDGQLSLSGSLFGKVPNLKLKAESQIKDLIFEGRSIPSITAKVEGAPENLNIAEVKVSLPNSEFYLKGNLNFDETFALNNIDLDCLIPKGPINDLPGFLPEAFKEASGTINAELKITGDPMSPAIDGELALSADVLKLSGMKKPFKEVDFRISTNDKIINFDAFKAKLGRGKVEGTGQVNFRDGPGSITANIAGEKIDLSFMNFEVFKSSAEFDISGNLYNPVIGGKVKVPRGKFHINTDLLEEKPPLKLFFNSVNYSIDVDVPRNFWLKSSFLNAEMKGKFTILGDMENINLSGGVECVQGWLYFQRRKFKIEVGELKFGGVEKSFDPHFFVKSEGQIQNTQVFLTLQGRISSFTPQIYSSPPMPEGDLLALLTLGRDLNTAMHSDSREIFESEILEGLKNSYISALIGNVVSSALNLDELFLTSLFDRTSGKSKSFLRVGKYIGNNIFIAYEGTLRDDDQENFIFEYRLPRGFVVNLEFKDQGKDIQKEHRVGVKYDWKFW